MNIRGYLSNQWGFSETGRILVNQVKKEIETIGIRVLDPFEECKKELNLGRLAEITDFEAKRQFWEDFSRKVTPINNGLMRKSHCQFAILDGGPAIDDGVASEIGYYTGLVEAGIVPDVTKGQLQDMFSVRKNLGRIFALRSDIRDSENIGCIVNPQVEGYIFQTGGKISKSLGEFYSDIRDWYNMIQELEKL